MAERLKHQIPNPKHQGNAKSRSFGAILRNSRDTAWRRLIPSLPLAHSGELPVCVVRLPPGSAVSKADHATTASAIHDVQSALLDIERGFSDCFAQGRVRMSGAADVFGAAAEFDHRNGFGN